MDIVLSPVKYLKYYKDSMNLLFVELLMLNNKEILYCFIIYNAVIL